MEPINQSFGVIVSIKMSDFDLGKELVINAFHEAGFEDGMCPRERMPRKAFQKALQESIEGEEGFMIRPVFKKGSTMSSGLVKEQKDEDDKNLKYDVCNVVTLNSEMEVIQGKSNFRTEAIVESYKEYRAMLGATEIGFKLKELFFFSMAIDTLCGKCIFIPNKFKPNVDKVVKLFSILKAHKVDLQIEIMGVDNDTQTRNTIVKEFSTQTLDLLQDEVEFCLKQREKFRDGVIKYLRPTAFKKQLGKIKILEERIKTYIVLLALTPEEDRPIVEKLEEVNNEINKNIELAQSLPKKKV